MNKTFKTAWVLLAFTVVGTLIYTSSAIHNEFLMDDYSQIVNNPKVLNPGSWLSAFTGSSLNEAGSETGIYYKPLMTLAYGVIWQLSPNDPFGFHVFQLSIHILSALLVYLLFLEFLPAALALFAGLFFLCHPYHAETVVYLADLQDILYLFFGLLAVYFLIRSQFTKWLHVPALFLLLLASQLSKESGMLFLFVTPIYAWLFLRSRFNRVTMVTLASGLTYFFIRWHVAGLHSLSHFVTRIGRADFSTRLLTAPRTLWTYLQYYIWPIHFTTSQDWVVEEANLQFWVPLLLLALVVAGFVYLGRKKKNSYFWWMFWWTLAGMGFHSHILVALDGTIAPRWFYFPFIGLTAMVLIALQDLLMPIRIWQKGMAFALLVLLSIASFVRAAEWQNNYTLFSSEILTLPDSYVVQNNYAVELIKRNELDQARKHLLISIDLAPHWNVSWNNLAATYHRSGDLEKAAEYYLHSIHNGPYAMAYENYVSILIQQHKMAEAWEFLNQEALRVFPQDPVLIDFKNALAKSQSDH